MTTRILPPDEWGRLAETGCQVQQAAKDAARGGCVLVTENAAGEIVGTLFVTLSVHFDGAWVREDSRDGGVLRRLCREAMTIAHAHGVSQVFAPVTNDALGAWLTRRPHARFEPMALIPVVIHG